MTIDKTHDYLLSLVGISNLLEGLTNLEDGLAEVAKLTTQILKTQRCSIMLLSESEGSSLHEPHLRVFTHYGNLPPSAYKEVTRLNEGIAGYVAATGETLLIKDIRQSRFATEARYPDDYRKSLICVPIILSKQVVGVINVSSPLERPYFEQNDLELLEIFALFVGKSIHIAQLKMITRSKFVELAVARDLAEKEVEKTLTVNPNPTKLAKIVAKSFFKELTHAGFGANQVITIATEVLNLLQDSLDRHKKRRERDE